MSDNDECEHCHPAGDLLDSLGLTWHQYEGDMVSDALVIMKVINAEGGVSLRMSWSDGMSWIERIGMLRAGEQIELQDLPRFTRVEDDD